MSAPASSASNVVTHRASNWRSPSAYVGQSDALMGGRRLEPQEAVAPSRRELYDTALRALASLWVSLDARPTTGRAAMRLLGFLDAVLQDGAPTPQVSSYGDGGVDVTFAVDRWSVEASFLTDDLCAVWITNPDDEQTDFFDGRPGALIPDDMLMNCRDRLHRMGATVRHRVQA